MALHYAIATEGVERKCESWYTEIYAKCRHFLTSRIVEKALETKQETVSVVWRWLCGKSEVNYMAGYPEVQREVMR